MATNTMPNETVYANAFLKLLKNNLVAGRLISGTYKDEVTDQNGLSVRVRRAPQFIPKDGATLAAQNIAVGYTDISVNRYRNVHIEIGDLEYVQTYNQMLQSQVMRGAASALAHDVDSYALEQTKLFASHVGTIGVDIASIANVIAPHTRLMDQSVPDNDLVGVLSYADSAAVRGVLVGSNIQGVNRSALENSKVPVMAGIDFYATQQLPTLTTGSRAITGEATVNGANQHVNYVSVMNQDYATLSINDFTGATDTVKKGCIFTIAGVYAVNQRTGQVLSYLKQFVVVEDATGVSNAITAMKYWPPIIVAGTGSGEADTNTAYQTVSASPANDAAIVWLGVESTSYVMRAAWQRGAIQMVSAKLRAPFSGVYSYAQDPDTGISIRYWRDSDVATGKHYHRWDMIYGMKNVDPRLGVRFNGTS